MIRHFCDGCSKEVKVYATVTVAPKWLRPASNSSFRYELCDECYTKLGDVILNIPDNTPVEDGEV